MSSRPRLRAEERRSTHLQEPERRALKYVERSGGAPLAPEARAFMEPRFGHNFADIRVHADGDAVRAAEDVNARAFTVGQDIVFNSGEFAPETVEGRGLLAHELAHAVQNARTDPDAHAPLVSAGDERGEAEARTVGARVGLGGAADVQSAPAAVISRSPQEDDGKGFFEQAASLFGLGESFVHGMAQKEFLKGAPNVGKISRHMGGSETLGKYGDVFGVYKGAQGIYGGLSSLFDGGGAGAGLDAGKGVFDTVSSYAGLLGAGRLEGGAGLASSAIDFGRGLHTAITSDDVKEATGGAYQVADSIAGGISSAGDATGNPFLMAGGRALGFGLDTGKSIVNWTDAGAKRRGDFGKNEYGENRTGSEAAADTWRSTEDYLDDYIPDWMATGIGAAHGIGASWWNAGTSAVNHIRENVTLDPDEIDWGKTVRPWRWFD